MRFLIMLFFTLLVFKTNFAISANTSDFKTVMCWKTKSIFDKGPILYTCNSYFCNSGYVKKYKNHKLCESTFYSDVSNHRWFGNGQMYVLCTQLLGFNGEGHDKCGLTIN